MKTVRKHSLLKLSLALLVAMPLFAGKFWEDKEFTAWTDKECKEMLTKSPWAYSNVFGEGPGPILNSDPSVGADATGPRPALRTDSFTSDVNIFFEFRLMTAKPIRMAMARLQLLQRPNDPTALGQAMNFVNTPPGNRIAFQLSYRTAPTGSSALHDIHSYFLAATIAEFRTTTYLIPAKGDPVSVEEYLSPGPNRSSPTFVFPRMDAKEQPLFGPEDKSVSLRSRFTPTIGGKPKKYDIYIKMNPKQMMFQKQLAM